MRVLVLFCHPVETSFNAGLHRLIVETLKAKGHEVDDCDLYAEDFDPRLSRAERIAYHDVPENVAPVADHVDRLKSADALVMNYPVWNFGYPAMLKGYFDRVFLPGVTFDIENGKVVTCLRNLEKVTVVTTYGGSRLRALLVGDPPRKVVMRVLRAVVGPRAKFDYLAHYDINRSTDETRDRFKRKVVAAMEAF